MIDEHGLGRSLDAKTPFFRPLVTDTLFFSSFFPPDQIGTSNCLILLGFSFRISRILGASVPFCLFFFGFGLLPQPESLRLPGFSRLHSSLPPLVSLFWRRFYWFASSCLSTLS